MRIGSLVVCVESLKDGLIAKDIVKGRIYTVRSFLEDDSGIRLEEVINDLNPFFGLEQGYLFRRFRELDTPTEIKLENILEKESYGN